MDLSNRSSTLGTQQQQMQGTQHTAHSGELGVDLRFAVRCLERLHSPWAGLSAVPAITAVPATRTGEQRGGGGEQRRQRGGQG